MPALLTCGHAILTAITQCLRLYIRICICCHTGPHATAGVTPGQFKYVEVVDVTAVRVEPMGTESAWNVDGELLANNHVTAQVHKGLLDIFARGVEGV